MLAKRGNVVNQDNLLLGRSEDLSESVFVRHGGALQAAPVVPADIEVLDFTFFVAGKLKQQRESRRY